mgnify:CR=1 FL=1
MAKQLDLESLACAAIAPSMAFTSCLALNHWYQLLELYAHQELRLPPEVYIGAFLGTSMLMGTSVIAGVKVAQGIKTYRSRS